MSFLLKLGESLLFGIIAPLTATCVLPLYPGFISFLANQASKKGENKKHLVLLGLLVSLGLILFMTLLGIIFTTILQISLTVVVQIISPIAFTLLAIVSILMILGIDIGKAFHSMNAPTVKSPKLNAFLYGFFFGAIIIPCNPGIIAVFFTRTVSTVGFIGNITSFLVFAIGMALPLLILAVLTQSFGKSIINFLTKNKRAIDIIAGIIMLAISLYYLITVFRVI